MQNKIIACIDDDVKYSNLIVEIKKHLEDYRVKALREIKSVMDIALDKNHKVMLINREKDLLLFCFKMETFIKGQSHNLDKSYFLEDFKKVLIFSFKEELISYIRKSDIDSNELLEKNIVLLEKLNFMEKILKSS